ncbi:unnamed protein product [Pieris macdunnoughi]|uniref:Uncharacterized protein n=1 Tax=Pieris macdunnoughi TaxID=345717 RepID=A0A821SP00_9NEOP|nr:unnamed protein product [Pieris macdunnoughi]
MYIITNTEDRKNENTQNASSSSEEEYYCLKTILISSTPESMQHSFESLTPDIGSREPAEPPPDRPRTNFYFLLLQHLPPRHLLRVGL